MIKIETHTDEQLPIADLELLTASVLRALHWNANGNEVLITTHERNQEGWLEYQMIVYSSTGKRIIFIGCIQRNIGQTCEFHS